MRMRDIKRWLSGLLCVAMLFSTMSVFGAVPKAKAASYDGAAAARWAGQNYKGNYGKCAEFVSHCLRDGGGLSGVYSASTSTLHSQLKNSGLFTEYKMTLSGKRIHPTASENAGKIAVGDVLIVHNLDSPSTYPHTSIVQAIEGDYVYIAQRNPAMAKGDQYAEYQNYKTYDQNGTNYEILCMHYTGGNIDPDYDELGCTTAYAGWYQETSSGGANVNSRHSKNWGDQVGVLAKGEYVYVSKATGTGSGNLGHIMYNGVERYIAMGLFKRANDRTGDPFGALDGCTPGEGGFRLTGWALDWDAPFTPLQINVYLDGNLVLQGKADVQRTDLNQNIAGDVGDYHGFNLWIPTDKTGEHSYSVYAINEGAGSHTCIKAGTVNIPSSDQEAPAISNVKVSNITTEGYDVSCTVTDNVGVNRVVFPTWTVLNDQDDIAAAWWDVNHPATRGTRNGDTWTFHVNIADHNNERGAYLTHIYAYDDAGNWSCTPCDAIVVPEPYPTITFDACGGKAEFTEKQLERNADGMHYGALPEAWMDGYVFEGWYTETAGGTRVSRSTAYTAKGNTTLYAQWTPVAADAEKGWSLQDGTLIITAQGAMQDHGSAAQTPWFKDRGDIRRIVVQKGVTTIGDYAFYGCKNVTSVTLPDTVTQIGKLAFYGCENLSTLTVPDSVLVVEDYAFANAAGLQSIVFRGNAPVMGAGIFAGLNLEVRYPTAAAGWTDGVKQSYTGSVRWSGVGASALAAQESDLQLDDPVLAALLADSCV